MSEQKLWAYFIIEMKCIDKCNWRITVNLCIWGLYSDFPLNMAVLITINTPKIFLTKNNQVYLTKWIGKVNISFMFATSWSALPFLFKFKPSFAIAMSSSSFLTTLAVFVFSSFVSIFSSEAVFFLTKIYSETYLG